MPFFVIAGKPDCKNYLHAKHVGNYLQNKLPDFNMRTMEKKTGEWEPWLINLNDSNGWHHTKSPIIWKELCSRGGRAYLIGNLSEFWEYCYDYYGLESLIPSEVLKEVAEDYVKHMEASGSLEEKGANNILKICITGASNPIMELFLPELCQLKELEEYSELDIRLYDRYVDSCDTVRFLNDIKENVFNLSLKQTVTLKSVSLLKDGLEECDLLIVADYFKCFEISDKNDLIVKKMAEMLYYADEINAHGKKSLRVVLTDCEPICFCATVLVESCTKIRISNIVAVTSNVGLSYLSTVSKHTGVPVEKLGGPPVWGFIGINQFVDVESIIKYSEVYYPYARSITIPGDSTLPKGKLTPELRYLSYLIKDSERLNAEAEMCQTLLIKKLYVRPTYSNIRSTISLLKLWYSKEENDDIISLGVCSNGAFGFPNGVVFSQPVMLNDKKIWQPFRKFPLTKKAEEKIRNLVPPTNELLDSFGVGRGYYSDYT